MHLDLVSLREHLGQYGLNPMDWCVEIRAKRGSVFQIDIHPLGAEGFSFHGWATREGWLSLALADL